MSRILVLGSGYTGGRVARLMQAAGHEVHATATEAAHLESLGRAGIGVLRVDSREPETLAALADLGRRLGPGLRVLHSVPTVAESGTVIDPTPRLLAALGPGVARLVHISTTGVYGDALAVDETSPAAPSTPRQRLRLEAEAAAAAGSWSTLTLRAAAIYGPGRGVHASMRLGRFRLVDGGGNVVSRIHVDDLAAVCAAGLVSELTGAFPVADDEPASSRAVAELCAALLGLPLPPSVAREQVAETLRGHRRVDGRAIRRLLGVELRYPSYRVGIPASIAAEAAAE